MDASADEWETVKPTRKKKLPQQQQQQQQQQRSNRNYSQGTGGKTSERDPSTLFPQYQPIPIPEGGFEQSIVLLVGLPGSGKSTFGRLVEKCLPWKYARVNQDELSSRQKCISRANQILRDGQCPIVDRCNFDPQQRSHFLNLSNGVPVDCIVFDIDPKICLSRCTTRRGHPTLPPNNAARVIGMMSKDWKPPIPGKEGFRRVLVIDNDQTFHEVMSQFVPIVEMEGKEDAVESIDQKDSSETSK